MFRPLMLKEVEMSDKPAQAIEVKIQPSEPLEHRCSCGILLWAALKRQDLPAPGMVHTCPECGKRYVRAKPDIKSAAPAQQASAAVDKKSS